MDINIVQVDYFVNGQTITEQQIIFSKNGQEITRENYTEEHFLYGVDLNNIPAEVLAIMNTKYV